MTTHSHSEHSRRRFGVALASILALSISCGRAHEPISSISNKALADEIQSGKAPLVLDVRSADEYRAGHIPGSVNIPHDQLAARLGELRVSKSDEVVVHCEGGGRAAKAEAILAASGYKNVVDLQGHMKGWREAGLPIE